MFGVWTDWRHPDLFSSGYFSYYYMNMPNSIYKTFCLALIALLFGGCAEVSHSPAEITPISITERATQQTLVTQLEFELDTGYVRTLKSGSQWTHIGRVSQGEVYKPFKDVFTLQGAQVHEAYLVVGNGKLVGFYLPVERGFSPLKQPISI